MKKILISFLALTSFISCKKDSLPSCKPITKKIISVRVIKSPTGLPVFTNIINYTLQTDDGNLVVDSVFYFSKNIGDTLCRVK